MNNTSLGQATLSDDELRIKIAELCGFTNVKPLIVKNVSKQGDDRMCGITSDQGWIPQYLSDLNAMHEAEKMLDYEKCEQYQEYLTYSVRNNREQAAMFVFHATARQRAEAFVDTMPPVRAGESSRGVGVVGEAQSKPALRTSEQPNEEGFAS